MEENLGKQYFRGKKTIELGSGTGLVGFCASLMGAEVTLSDKFDTMDLLNKNVEANKGVKVKVADYSWGTPADALEKPYDVIVGSELIYNGRLYNILVTSLDLISDKGTEFVMSFERRATEDTFMEMIKEKWETIQVKTTFSRLHSFLYFSIILSSSISLSSKGFMT